MEVHDYERAGGGLRDPACAAALFQEINIFLKYKN